MNRSAHRPLTVAFATVASVASVAASLCAGEGKPLAPSFAKPPKNAVVLFDGKDISGWRTRDGQPCPWKVGDGAMTCVPRSGHLYTKRRFRDVRLHIEFRTPHKPNARGQARGNSGVILQGRYEIQVLDSHGIDRPKKGDCGALYGLIAPSTNACLPPMTWQSYDITFRAPKFDKRKLAAKGRITVVHNGIAVIDDREIPRPTKGGSKFWSVSRPGALMLQDHRNEVAYRNIWVVPLEH